MDGRRLYGAQLRTERCDTDDATEVDEVAVLERGLRGGAVAMGVLLEDAFELSEMHEGFTEDGAGEKAREALREVRAARLVLFPSSQAQMPKKRLAKD
ncbi:hypothetical protein PMIN04_004965 [Paraphaeosphaeria minitans]